MRISNTNKHPLTVLALAVAVSAASAPMARSQTNPYTHFKFNVSFDGMPNLSVTTVSPLVFESAVTDYRQGSDPLTGASKIPGITKYDPITLERGLTNDKSFYNWANQVVSTGSSGSARNGIVRLLDDSGNVVVTFDLFLCWPSGYQALSMLDANTPGVAIEKITLQCRSWRRE
jgi:phage tail-like protein